ncbi:CHAT domain-containing protein [Pseudonocardia sp. TRM90224]|uniref:CHAT domain-containing protein n=1 Tax=Pseudonocardia sp. TRM90224 TaxID=2812678 RepID=UPI001E424649|nr:CHAT domain-containing tetratricopeptide repeat protein [Pseudonocardia sp. TRM90224]
MSIDVGAARDAAEQALALASGDPRAALELAGTAAAAAHAEPDPAAEATAHRAWALALCELGERETALDRVRTAVAVAVRGGVPAEESKARLLAAYLLGAMGHTRAALREADRAQRGLIGLAAALAASQRALILQEAGRLDEAMAAYAAALPVFRQAGDRVAVAKALGNRAVGLAYSGRLDEAEADLVEARDLYRELGLERLIGNADMNLGFVASRRGDAPAALEHYQLAEDRFGRLGVPVWRVLICRFEVLVAVGLVAEARRVAERAAALLAGSANAADLAEVRLLLAQVALAERDAERARADGTAAREMFRRQSRRGWELVARFTVLRADELAGAQARRLQRAAGECAAELAAAGWRVAELDARLVAARAALRAGDMDAAVADLAVATAARRAGSLELRVRAWHATALLRDASGDRRGTRSALRAGLAVVDRYRAGLGATDLRAHVAGHAEALATMGLQLAVADGSATGVLAWAERWRAGAVALRPVRPPDDPELAHALAEVRRLTTAQVEAQLAGRPGPALAALAAAEQRVVAASRSARSPLHRGGASPPQPAELVAALGDAVLVEYVRHGDRMLAVTVRAGARPVLHRLGAVDVVEREVAAAQFALRRLAYGGGSARSQETHRAAARRAGERLDRLLLGPLAAEIAGVADRPLVVVPTGVLHPLPWSLLPSLAGRSVRVAPSAASWLAAARSRPGVPGGRVVAVAGPRLAAAEGEARAVRDRYRQADLLVGDAATAPAVLAALDGADHAHIAAHGTLRTDNPLFSALELADGPLTVYDLERLEEAPRVVVLPACGSGASAVGVGDEVMGLVAALLALGAHSVVAPLLSVSDAATAPLMDALHAELAGGAAPADALAAVRRATAGDAVADATAAAFTCFGA